MPFMNHSYLRPLEIAGLGVCRLLPVEGAPNTASRAAKAQKSSGYGIIVIPRTFLPQAVIFGPASPRFGTAHKFQAQWQPCSCAALLFFFRPSSFLYAPPQFGSAIGQLFAALGLLMRWERAVVKGGQGW